MSQDQDWKHFYSHSGTISTGRTLALQTFAATKVLPRAELDQSIEILQKNSGRWAKLPVGQKEELVNRLMEGVLGVADGLVTASLVAKGITPGSIASGEEWIGGPVVILRNLRMIGRSLHEIVRYGFPRIRPGKSRTRSNGQVIVEVFPETIFDKMLLPGIWAEVWMQPEVRIENLNQTMAAFYQKSEAEGKVVLVLGAGNYSCLGPLDVVYKMFVEGAVCLLKFNPINDYIGPFIEEAFSPLIREGYLRLAYGGADVGSYLSEHQGVDEIHITGGARTHDAIVFGPGEEGADRKRRNQPRLRKPITSELGNVSPVIVVPGPWSKSDLKFQAENIATLKANNAGFNCLAAQVMITQRDWSERQACLDALRDTLRRVPGRRAYYPGASDRYADIIRSHPEAEALGPQGNGILPWTLISSIDPEHRNDPCFTQEAFCSIMSETSLLAGDPAEFLDRAVDFCNNNLYGTLNASIIIHPQTAKELGPRLEETVANLAYGGVGVNSMAAVNYLLGTPTWGAYPGHTLDDIQSGIGVVHNSLMFDNPQKSVVYGPFRPRPKPPWFVTNKAGSRLGPVSARFEAHPSWTRLPGLIWNAR